MGNHLFLYSYDGSGVPLSRRCELVSTEGDRAVIRFAEGTAPSCDTFGGDVDLPNGDRETSAKFVRPVDAPAPALASFNFLD
jgi:hypothetical protein